MVNGTETSPKTPEDVSLLAASTKPEGSKRSPERFAVGRNILLGSFGVALRASKCPLPVFADLTPFYTPRVPDTERVPRHTFSSLWLFRPGRLFLLRDSEEESTPDVTHLTGRSATVGRKPLKP